MPLMQSTICKQWKIPDLWWLLYTLNPWATFKVFISSIDWPLRSLDRDEKRCNERSRLFLLLWLALLFSWKFNDFHTYRRKIGWPPSSIYVEWLVEKFWLCYILLLLSFLTFMVMKIGLIHYILQFLHPFQMSSAWSNFHSVWKSLKKSHCEWSEQSFRYLLSQISHATSWVLRNEILVILSLNFRSYFVAK